ncbi:unnamed protein product [Periconia digitata]|uniref:Uncharacterized protein n=1 Tax=Periconia digitata TaxID=1303443 RepID=A0A9W4XK10_9PLEO|nr:unnamed protein product [Periconia digitata]
MRRRVHKETISQPACIFKHHFTHALAYIPAMNVPILLVHPYVMLHPQDHYREGSVIAIGDKTSPSAKQTNKQAVKGPMLLFTTASRSNKLVQQTIDQLHSFTQLMLLKSRISEQHITWLQTYATHPIQSNPTVKPKPGQTCTPPLPCQIPPTRPDRVGSESEKKKKKNREI